MQIRTRLTLQFTLLVSSILLVACVAIYYFTYINAQEDFYAHLRSRAESTSLMVQRFERINNDLIKIHDDSNRDLIFNINTLIFDDKDQLIYSNVATPAIHVSKFWLMEIRKAGQIQYRDGAYSVVGTYFKYPFNREVVVTAGQDLYGKVNLANLRVVLLVLFLIITAIVFIAGWVFSWRALLPISEVMNELEGVLPQNLEKRLAVPNQKDEIGRLTLTFNSLLDRIENAFKLQKMFVANISHELKNPLMKISSQLEVSLLKERTTVQYRKTEASVLEDIGDLTRLSNALLDLAKVSQSRPVSMEEIVRVDDLLFDAKDILQKSISQYKVNLHLYHLPEDHAWLEIMGNAALLRTAFLNLMENACKFSDDNSCDISLSASARAIRLEFADKGKGITDEELTWIFQPFYRGKNTVGIKGYGIGLSLVDKIVQLHKGIITIERNQPRGTIFKLAFLETLSALHTHEPAIL